MCPVPSSFSSRPILQPYLPTCSFLCSRKELTSGTPLVSMGVVTRPCFQDVEGKRVSSLCYFPPLFLPVAPSWPLSHSLGHLYKYIFQNFITASSYTPWVLDGSYPWGSPPIPLKIVPLWTFLKSFILTWVCPLSPSGFLTGKHEAGITQNIHSHTVTSAFLLFPNDF